MNTDQQPLREGAHELRGCIGGIVGMIIGAVAFLALLLWGGTIGRSLIYATGFGIAGLILPFVAEIEPKGENGSKILLTLCIVCGIIGFGVGIGAGMNETIQVWWVNVIAGFAFVVGIGWILLRGGRSWSRWRNRLKD